MTDLLALSARYIDEGGADGPNATNPMSGELRELVDGIAMVEAFSHVVAFRTDDGLPCSIPVGAVRQPRRNGPRPVDERPG